MMNTILGDSQQMRFHTDVNLVFQAFGGRQNEFNWLLTDLECYPSEPLYSEHLYPWRSSPLWLTGEQLTGIVEKHCIQFVWGVLSGFTPEMKIDLNSLDVEPRAEGHPTIWIAHPTIQHPKAIVEIVCCDSSFTFLLSKDDDLSMRFRNFFPEAKDLDEHNARNFEYK